MANYIISANTNPERKIRTNTSGLSKSIKVLLDEGYESVTVTVVPETLTKKQPKFKVGDTVLVINSNFDEIPVGSRVKIEKFLGTTKENFYRVNGCWAFYESQLRSIKTK